MEVREREEITKQPCSVRGCKNKAYLLYPPLEGGKPICRKCLKIIKMNEKELKFKECQLYFNFMRS